MVARISTGKSIIGLINYNENKVAKGDARLLAARNMVLGKKESELTYDMKVGTFQRILDGKKNRKLDKPTLHISLNFDPSEKPTDENLQQIATKYMEGMGYGNQPFLVYRHEDTRHPHMHIVSIKVDREGNKVDDTFFKRRSDKLRKALEVEYNLVKASEKMKQFTDFIASLPLEAIKYGKSDTKAAISGIVRNIQTHYKFSSLNQFQTLLRQYNIKVEHIKGTSKKADYEGLIYSLTDSKGRRVGVGIKASSIYSKPTLPNLRVQFKKNSQAKIEFRIKTANEVGKVLSSYRSITKEEFTKQLSKQGIIAIYHQGEKGKQSLIFIDHVRKAIFKEGELGKSYRWKNLQKHFGDFTIPKQMISNGLQNEIVRKNSSKSDFVKEKLLREASSALAIIYNRLRKANSREAYFESTFVKKLHQINLADPLLKELPSLTYKQATDLEQRYKKYKQNKLKVIENKEIDYFGRKVEIAFRFIEKHKDRSPVEKISFLYRYGLQVRKEEGQIIFQHSRGEHLKVTFEEEAIKKLLGYKDILPSIDTRKFVQYSKADRDSITHNADISSDDKATRQNISIKDQQVILPPTYILPGQKNTPNNSTISCVKNNSGVDSHEANTKKKKRNRKISG